MISLIALTSLFVLNRLLPLFTLDSKNSEFEKQTVKGILKKSNYLLIKREK